MSARPGDGTEVSLDVLLAKRFSLLDRVLRQLRRSERTHPHREETSHDDRA